ncbi:uncharacterized protein LOC109790008 [Cajanus cajan]|uniref:uncharacterized protein LOC109790008 n=1 Tax=Cajanus cajan TaxID=3821 RepID=UPI00098DACD8|nr:uncharacterized protein LOC109790008 [Cajanus cajan]
MNDKKRHEHCASHVDRDAENGKAILMSYLPNHLQPKHLDNLKNLKGRKNLLVSCYTTGGKNPCLWSTKIPRRKRSRVLYKKKISPMKKFRKQLLELWKKYGNLDESSQEEILLFNNVNNFIPSYEIGLGGVLLKPDDTST